MLQILQIIQLLRVKKESLEIVSQVSKNNIQAFKNLGFILKDLVIKLLEFTNRTLWACYGQYLSIGSMKDKTSETADNFICRVVSQLLLREIDPLTFLGIRHKESLLQGMIATIPVDSKQIELEMIDVVTLLTRMPLSIVTHSLVNRVQWANKQNLGFHETTLQLLQYVSITMVTCNPNHKVFVGDNHTFRLCCEKCQTLFGKKGNIAQVMANASNSILYHYGLELNYTCKGDHVIETEYWYKNSLPMHSKTSPIHKLSISANLSQ